MKLRTQRLLSQELPVDETDNYKAYVKLIILIQRINQRNRLSGIITLTAQIQKSVLRLL